MATTGRESSPNEAQCIKFPPYPHINTWTIRDPYNDQPLRPFVCVPVCVTQQAHTRAPFTSFSSSSPSSPSVVVVAVLAAVLVVAIVGVMCDP